MHKVKFYYKNEYYTVKGTDKKIVLPLLHTREGDLKGEELKIHRNAAESVMKRVLKTCALQEYVDRDGCFVLNREGYPGNWMDFSDMLLSDRLAPVIGSVSVHAEVIRVSFLDTVEKIVYLCEFEDDDVFSNLYALVSECNICEVVTNSRRLERPLSSMGIIVHTVKGAESLDMLVEHLKLQEYQTAEYVAGRFLKIDNGSLRALDVFPNLFEMFDVQTNQGARLLQKFFKQPLKNEAEISKRLNYAEMLTNKDFGFLKDFPDLLRLSKKIEGRRINIQEILRLYQVIGKIDNIVEVLGSCMDAHGHEEFVVPLENLKINFEPLLAEIKDKIDFEKAARNEFTVKIDKESLLRNKILEKIENEKQRVFRTNRNIKFDSSVFKISRSKAGEVDFKEHRFLELSVLKSGVTFTTKDLCRLTEELKEADAVFLEKEKEIKNELVNFMGGYLSLIEVYNFIVSYLDVLHAFGMKCVRKGFCRPVFNCSKYEIVNSFHPLLDGDCVLNSVRMEEKRLCVVTGPNMGGKSTFIKQCAIISILAQMGCYVPAEYACVPVFDGIYTRIGASDCASKGVSTFMLEMMDISRICRMSTANSLVIIDELGRGTSAADGLSMALAVKEHLLEKSCVSFFATHFPELCSTDVLNKRVKTMLSDESVTLLYEIEDGVCDTSFGLFVAEKVGFPECVVENSKRFMKMDN